MNENKIFQTPRASRSKRLTIGAASVLAAGALLGAGVQGATASPLTDAPDHTAGSNASTSASSTSDASTNDGAFLSSIQKELRGDVSRGQDLNEKAQKVAATLVDHAELFATLPANLQADLTTLTDASAADRTAAVETIRTTALAGGYGEQATQIATAVQDDPKHPLAAALHSVLGDDSAVAETGSHSAAKLALRVVDNPALLAKLPADLQSALTELKNTPAAEQDAAAQAIVADAANGAYGDDIQKFAERLQARTGGDSHAHTAGSDAGADASTNTGSGTDAHAGAHAKAGN